MRILAIVAVRECWPFTFVAPNALAGSLGVVTERTSNAVFERIRFRQTAQGADWIETTITAPHGVSRVHVANRLSKPSTMEIRYDTPAGPVQARASLTHRGDDVRVVEQSPWSRLVVSCHLCLHLGILRLSQDAEGAHKDIRGDSVVLAVGDCFDEVYGVATNGAR